MAHAQKRFYVMDDFDLRGKTVFLRVDINSPISPADGSILDHSRFMSHLDTIGELSESKLVIAAHQSRPGKDDFTSLYRHSQELEMITGRKVRFIDSLFGHEVTRAVREMADGDILMLENTRFYSEEVVIDPEDIETMEHTHLVRNLSSLFDYYIIDAFPAIHRAQTSLVGFRRIRPNIAGRLIEREVTMLDRFMMGEAHPKLAILAGSKIEDSVNVAENFLANDTVDKIIAGGVVANAFLWAGGKEIGKRNRDYIIKNNKNYNNIIKKCQSILEKYSDRVILPVDFILNPSGRAINSEDKVPDQEIMADSL